MKEKMNSYHSNKRLLNGGEAMKKLGFFSIIVIIGSLLIGCSEKEDEEPTSADEDEEEVVDEEQEPEEVDEEDEEENQEDEPEEETFADEIDVLDVQTVLVDQEVVSGYHAKADIFIEHDEIIYVEHDFITQLLDYELTYEEENTFAETFEGKGNFRYDPSHQDEGGALMDLGQIYVEDLDTYEDISGSEEELYKFIEYGGRLYVPERLINVYMKSPLNYERRNQTVEIGLHAESISVYDIGVSSESSSSAEVTKNASDVTIEGENHDGGIVLRSINSADKSADIDVDYNFSEITGFVHNKSDDETIEIKFQYSDEKTLDSVELKPGETHEFDYDVKGESVLKIVGVGRPGSSSEAVIVGELK